MRLATRVRTFGLCACVVTFAEVLTACGSGKNGGDDTATRPPAAATPTAAGSTPSADPDAREKAAVLAVGHSMWAEQMKAYKVADSRDTELTKYASLDALAKVRLDLAQMKKAGTLGGGEVGRAPRASFLPLDASLPKATVTDCIHLSKRQVKRTTTGEVFPLPTNRPHCYVAPVKVKRWDDGRWLVVDYTPNRETPVDCHSIPAGPALSRMVR